MDKKEKILKYLQQHPEGTTKQFVAALKEPQRTIARYVKELLDAGKIIKKRKGRRIFYTISLSFDIIKYFDTPHFAREKQSYNESFLSNYIPNKTNFLSKKQKKILLDTIQGAQKINTIDYNANIRQMENILIDLSFASSNLEGNTYSYLDTEVLIKYHEKADNKTKFETTMILNHKNAIQYILEIKNEIIDIKNLLLLHTILAKELLPSNVIGKIRQSEVQIGGSAYTPLSGSSALEKEAQLFISLYNQIKDPFEQAVFSLVFLSYFQLFHDCNKRTSRLFANIGLLKHGYPPISLLQMKKKDYIDAILSVYELNNSHLLSKLFVENYLLNYKRYIPIDEV